MSASFRRSFRVCLATTAGLAALSAPVLSAGAAAAPPVVSGVDATVTVPTVPTPVSVRVVRSGDTTTALSVRYDTVDGTAHAGVDYRPASGIVTIPAGARSAVVQIEVLPHAGGASSTSFRLHLSDPVGTAPVTAVAMQPHSGAAVGPAVEGAVTVDVDGDGRPDVVTSNYSQARLDVSLNTTPASSTDPTFAAAVGLPTLDGPFKPATCDLNNDGRPDLVAAGSNTNQLTVQMNTTVRRGAISFTRTDVRSLDFGFIHQVTCADVNGDGRLDLIGASRGSDVSPGSSRAIVFRNLTPRGAAVPVFATPVGFAATGQPRTFSSPVTVAALDVNGDGRPDIALGNLNTQGVTVMLNTTPAGSSKLSFGPPAPFTTGESPADMAVLDVNGDGRPDLVTSNFDGAFGSTFAVLMNRTAKGASTPSFASFLNTDSHTPYGVAAADVDLDGRPDLVISELGSDSSPDGSLQVLLDRTPKGSASPVFTTSTRFAAGDDLRAVAVADLNGDTVPDLVTANFDGSASSGPLLTFTQTRTVTPGTVRRDATVVVRR